MPSRAMTCSPIRWRPTTIPISWRCFAIYRALKEFTATKFVAWRAISTLLRTRSVSPRWDRGDGPEEADLGGAHYLMTPWHALQLALTGEKRALEFFASVVATAKDAEIKKMAEEFVEEEAEHVNLVHRLLRKYQRPSESWSSDDDPPVAQE